MWHSIWIIIPKPFKWPNPPHDGHLGLGVEDSKKMSQRKNLLKVGKENLNMI